MYDPVLFAEKFQLARESAIDQKPQGGLCGFELEWNLLDSQLRPLNTVGSGPDQLSFVDFVRRDCLSPWSRAYSQLEVFNWMLEWATRPYYEPRAAVYEARLLEGVLQNALKRAGEAFGDRLFYWHGNLLFKTDISAASIPGSWHIAKRRYLERCVDLFGEALATAGIHANLSLPEPLFAWDFMHLSPSLRGDSHLDDYKSRFYILSARLLRAFAALFIATSASTPFVARVIGDQAGVFLTPYASNRNLTFPNPPALDVPDLYRSLEDYLRISYDLVRRGVRFGNNNWTPVRARSSVEPVERLVMITSEQLHQLYQRGLYAAGQEAEIEELAQQVEKQNLLARINLPMMRVEVRTDEGGNPLELELANMTLKYLLLMRIYADDEFGRAFRYDAEDVARARRSEHRAAQDGLAAQIEHPFSGKLIGMRDFLRWTIEQVRPLAEALGVGEDLLPLIRMAAGAPNTAEALRRRALKDLGEVDQVPIAWLKELIAEHEAEVAGDIAQIASSVKDLLPNSAARLGDFLINAREDAHYDLEAPIRFRPRPDYLLEYHYPDKASEVIELAQTLIRIPSVTACSEERLEEVRRAAILALDYARDAGLQVRFFDREKYPALLLSFPGNEHAPVMLSGHLDVVPPEPDDSQFNPLIEGDYLVGRGAADMKTVAATYLVWMKDMLRQGPPYPPINLLLVGNEENGEMEPMGTPHVLKYLLENPNGSGESYAPSLLIAGERTGEKGDERWGEVCTQNRGVMRFDVVVHGEKGHSGVRAAAGAAPASADLTERLLLARSAITGILGRHFTLHSPDGWQTQARFPFIQVGQPGVYNITAGQGTLGVEIRPIPGDRLQPFYEELQAYCASQGLELAVSVMEDGIACREDNPYLLALLRAIQRESGQAPMKGKKLPATSARFAPQGQGVVWGQAGVGPHARNEKHYIPSIEPYYQVLTALARELR